MTSHSPKPRVLECINEKIIKNNAIFYEVKWKGIQETTIESIETLKDRIDIVEKFEKELSKRIALLEKTYFNPKEVITIDDDDEEDTSQIYKTALINNNNNNNSLSNGHTNQNISDFSSLDNSIKISQSANTFTHEETDFFHENHKESCDSKRKHSGKNSLEIEFEELLKQNRNFETKENKNINTNNANINDSNSNKANENEEKLSKTLLQDKKAAIKKNNSLEKKPLFDSLLLNESNKNKDPFTVNYFLRKPEETLSLKKDFVQIQNYFTSFQKEKSQTKVIEKSAKDHEKHQKTNQKDFNEEESFNISANKDQEGNHKRNSLERDKRNHKVNENQYFDVSYKKAKYVIEENKNTSQRDSSEKHEKRLFSKINEKVCEIYKKSTNKAKISEENLIYKPKLLLDSDKNGKEIRDYCEELDNITVEEIRNQFGIAPFSKGNLKKDKISGLKSIIKEKNAMFGKVIWKKRKNDDHMAPTILPLNMVKEAAPRETAEFFLQCFEKEIKNNLF